MLIASNFLLWVLVALLAIAVLALVRQIGQLRMRITALGRLTAGGGAHVGERAPHVPAQTLDGAQLSPGIGQPGAHGTLIVFVAPECDRSRRIIPAACRIAARQRLDLLWIGAEEDDADEQRALVERFDLDRQRFVRSAAAAHAFRIDMVPHAVLLRADGVLAASGAVSSAAQIEHLARPGEAGGVASGGRSRLDPARAA